MSSGRAARSVSNLERGVIFYAELRKSGTDADRRRLFSSFPEFHINSFKQPVHHPPLALGRTTAALFPREHVLPALLPELRPFACGRLLLAKSRHKLGAHPRRRHAADHERAGDDALTNRHDLAKVDVARRLGGLVLDGDTATPAGSRGEGPRFEEPDGPEPSVEARGGIVDGGAPDEMWNSGNQGRLHAPHPFLIS
jgi:hypothetical protein